MALRTCTINGQTHWPTSITGGRRKVGELLEADNGGATLVSTGQKGQWELRWEKPKEAIVNQLEAIYLLTTNVTFVYEGVSYTVCVPPDGFDRSTVHGDSRSNGATTFACRLTLREV